MAEENKRSRASTFNLISLVVGLVLFVFLLVRLDTHTIGEKLRDVGWFFVPAFLCYVANLFFAALAWKATIDPRHSRATIFQLWHAFWAGHAINAVTPGGGAGELVKASLLRGRLEGKELVASLILYNGINLVVTAGASVVGAVLCYVFLDVPREATGIILGVSLGLFFVFSLVLWWVHSGAVSHVIRLATKLPFIKIDDKDSLVEKAKEIDRRMTGLVRDRPGQMARSVFFASCVRVLQIAETSFLLYPLMPPQGLVLIAIFMQTASNLIVWLAAFVPAKIGVLEGGNVGLFQLAGLDPVVAFTVVVAGRFRMVLGVLIGLALGSRFVGHRTAHASTSEDP